MSMEKLKQDINELADAINKSNLKQ